MDGLLAARIVSMICLGLVTWIIGIRILASAYNLGLSTLDSTTLVAEVSKIKLENQHRRTEYYIFAIPIIGLWSCYVKFLCLYVNV